MHNQIYHWENKNTTYEIAKKKKKIANEMSNKGLSVQSIKIAPTIQYKQKTHKPKKKKKLIKNGQKSWIDISLKKIYRWLSGTCNYTRYC